MNRQMIHPLIAVGFHARGTVADYAARLAPKQTAMRAVGRPVRGFYGRERARLALARAARAERMETRRASA